MRATALAHSNIALVKYWGKRDVDLNLPAAGSVSLTLAGMSTRTTVEFDTGFSADTFELDGEVASPEATFRVSQFLDLCWYDDERPRARVVSSNDFPTAAGLASSASGFAALAVAATSAAERQLNEAEVSVLARRGSGSAARSVVSGFAWMSRGERADGMDCHAYSFADPDYWDLRCVVALCARGKKAVGSTDGMTHTMQTSPYYDAWVETVAEAMVSAREAVLERDFERLASVAEASCLQMHASAQASRPGVLYWNGTTVELIHAVREWRAEGLPVFFTIDAGPHVKVFCPASHVEKVRDRVADVDGVLDILEARPGHGARVVEDDA